MAEVAIPRQMFQEIFLPVKMDWKSIVRYLMPPVLKRALRPSPSVPTGGYISATETVAAANAAGLSVCDYVERLWQTLLIGPGACFATPGGVQFGTIDGGRGP